MEEGSFEGVGGLRIFTRAWHPNKGSPRAVVVISHGFNSHSGHYLWVGEQLSAHGFAVHALDHRGRGLSEGERFYVNQADDYIADLATFIRLSKSYHSGLPVFLLGHSAGGVISCLYALEHQDEIDGMIIESFAHELPAPDFALRVLKGLSYLIPHTPVLKLDNTSFSRDPKVVEALQNDPLIANETQPTQTVATLVRADERLKTGFATITLPIFILHGTEDRVTKPSGSQHFYEQAGSTDKRLKLYEGHYHDLLNDIDKEQVLADIQAWMDTRIPLAREVAS